MNPIKLCVALTALLLTTQAQAAAPLYSVTEIGLLPGYGSSRAYDINNNGQVVGHVANGSNLSHPTRAILWENGVITDLGTLGGTQSSASSINAAGQVAGTVFNSDNKARAVYWSNGEIHDLGTLGGTPYDNSYGLGINNSGQVVGYAASPVVSNGSDQAFLWDGENLNNLNPNGTPLSHAYAINNLGDVVGASWAGQAQAYVWIGGIGHYLNTPSSTSSYAWDINDNRQVVGAVSLNSHGGSNPFIWTEADGMVVIPNLPNASICSAYGINSTGQVVGECSMSGANHSFLWSDGVLTDLNDLIDPASGWWISEARAINDQGQIVGHGVNADGEIRGFVLTLPVPEPETYAMMLAGLALVGVVARHRKKSES